MKRVYEDGGDNEQELEEGQQEEEEGEYCPIAGPSTFSLPLPPPPPPPPLLRLAVHHSTQNPSANLLPSHQTLALMKDTTTIGRDKSYESRIRLKTLEVSRTHATIFQEQQQQRDDSHPDINHTSGKWFIVDNASTHGTYLRRFGEEHYTRLSEKGQSSLPRQLKHLDTIKIANQRFIVHLHPPEEGNDCEICSVKEDRSNLVPLLEDTSALKTASSVPSNSQVQYHAPMDEKTAKTFTKEEKRENFKSNMQSLRKSLLSGGPASSTSSRQTTPKATSNQAASSIHSQAGLSASEDSSPSVESPRYVDRAKLRRSIHPPQHGLSDADPPHHHQGKRSRFSSPSQNAPPPKTEPSYGPGAALFQKMMTGNETTVPSEKIAGTADSTAINVPSRKEVKLGKIIEVRTMAERSAGLGSGMVRQGVEQHANPMDWRDAARQRRWKEANR